jgi:hypothetical protein
MILKDSYNEVVFNSDDPERQLVVSELLIERVIIFGITFLSRNAGIFQKVLVAPGSNCQPYSVKVLTE